MNDNDELVKQLHGFADWLEGTNNVHCISVPRQAAYTITRLEEENRLFRLRLNKRDQDLTDHINRVVGLFRLFVYKWKKRLTK